MILLEFLINHDVRLVNDNNLYFSIKLHSFESGFKKLSLFPISKEKNIPNIINEKNYKFYAKDQVRIPKDIDLILSYHLNN